MATLRDKMLRRVPDRYRPLAARLFVIVLVAFVIFEATRALAIGQLLLPSWEKQVAGHLNDEILAYTPQIAAIGFAVSAAALAIQVALLFFAWRWLKRVWKGRELGK